LTGLGNKEILSRNLKRYIERSGKDRRELAEIWGFPYSTVTGWVNGQKYPRIDRIEIMADYFGILKSDLIEDKSQEEIKEPAIFDGLSENQKKLMQFVQTVPESKADMILRVIQSIVESD
jgi:transcriptional regulator with XRE-family HTH domain